MVIRAHECVMAGSSRSIDDIMVHSFAWIHLKEKVQHAPRLLHTHLLLLPYLHHLTTRFSLHLSNRFRMVSSALPTVNSLQSSVPRSATRQCILYHIVPVMFQSLYHKLNLKITCFQDYCGHHKNAGALLFVRRDLTIVPKSETQRWTKCEDAQSR